MHENANRPSPGGAGSQPLRWDAYGPQHAQPTGQYGQPIGQYGRYHQPTNPYGAPTNPYAAPGPYGQAPPPPYGPGGYGQPYAFVPPGLPRHRRRALPAALAGIVAALVLAGAVLLHGGTGAALPGIGSGTSANGTATSSSTTPDYDTGVVNITAVLGSQNSVAAGTGMILDGDGTVLTNNHVVEDATSITATDVNTGKEYSASLVGTDANDDIAVIQLRNASGLTPVTIGDSSSVTVGQKVVAIGNAGGRGGTPSVVTGQVTALDQTITATDSSGGNAETLNGLIQVDAPIVAGDSGGPLTDASGKVIGIDTAASASQAAQGFGGGFGNGNFRGGSSSSGSTEGFAIPIQHALTIAKQIESGQSDSSSSGRTDEHGYLGVQITDDGTGAAVAGTVVGSPAASAGIGSGDTIVALDGTSVSSASQLSQQLENTKAGQSVSVSWVDSSGTTHTATVTLMGGSA